MREFFPLKTETPPGWAEFAIQDFDSFLIDHASCERKAAATCMSFVGGHPDKPELCDVMITLAREEMEHFQQAFRIMRQRGLQLEPGAKDPYVNALLKEVRTTPDARFMDRLLISGIVEARSCERLGLVGQELVKSSVKEEAELGQYYSDLAVAEARHYGLFTKFAEKYFPKDDVQARLDELLECEAKVVQDMPWRAAVH